MPKTIMIVAGEASADRYGARLVKKLKERHGAEAISFYGTGGDEMQDAGVCLRCHIRDLAHIGVREAVSNLLTYYRTYRSLVKEALKAPPDLAVLLDFPEFNLRLAKRLKRIGVRIVYYISPQIWAWRGGRIGTIRKYVDKMLVILPFEENYYRERGMDAEFVGHPILEDFSIQGDRAFFQKKLGLDPSRPTVALLPGSRQKEVGYILPMLLQASLHLVSRRPVQFVVSVAPSVRKCQVEAILDQIIPRELKNCFRMSFDPSRDVLAHSDFAFVKSGTSTLEAALVGVPFLVTYRISRLSWWIGSVLIQTPMKGLVNLIAGDEIVPEFYQNAATPEALANVALGYLNDPAKSLALRERLSSIRERLGSRHASETAAAAVSGYL